MKHAFAWTIPLALAAVLPQTLKGDPMSGDTQDILDAVATMTQAFQSANIEQVMASYEPGSVVLFEPGTPVIGAGAQEAMFQAASSLEPVFTYGGHEVVVSGNTALHIAPWEMTGQLPDGRAIEQSGLSVAVLHKQTDGSWRIVIDNPHGSRLLDPVQ